jgi:D-xylose transport system permease protein
LSAGSGVGLLGGIASVLVFEHKWPAPLAMGIALAIGILLWFCMGNLVVRQKMPAFIITLGGLLIFKGLFWLVIHNSTIPIAQGGRANLYSVLTTFYLPPIAGYVLAALIVVALVVGKLRARKARQTYGFAVEDGELVFLKLFLAAQLIFLFVVVTNKFRGIPFSAVILGVTAFTVYVHNAYTVRTLSLCNWRQRGSCDHFRRSRRKSRCWLVQHHGRHRSNHRIHADFVLRRFDNDGWRSDGT